ncbi:nitrilase-related carbon-nitrogen hydrolase [Spirosoma aerophilum]
MTLLQRIKRNKQPICAALLVATSGLAWYFGNALTGTYWYLVWLAPIPLLGLAYDRSPRTSFWLAFAACLLGRLSWLAYLQTLVTIFPALLLTLALAYVFARILVWSTTIAYALNAWYTVFAYPVLMTSFEYLVGTFSPDGTATSLAYTQADVVPLIQIASVTGSLGITFLVSLFPALMALGWRAYHRNRSWIPSLVRSAVLVYGLSFFYSWYRLSAQKSLAGLRVGLVALDEKRHHKAQQRTAPQLRHLLDDYSQAVASAAEQGAAIIVLPETAIRVRPDTYQPVVASLKCMAHRYAVSLVVGLADFSQPQARNRAMVINSKGEVVANYTKNHLVGGFERQFTPGNQVGLFSITGQQAGVAICKDLDFAGTIRRYGNQRIMGLFVPANDFVVDAWLHSRMALVRGVENGFALVRTARQGRLLVSDGLGQVLSEATTSGGNKAILMGTLPASPLGSFYARTGNWFGLVNLLVAAYFVWRARFIRKSGLALLWSVR